MAAEGDQSQIAAAQDAAKLSAVPHEGSQVDVEVDNNDVAVDDLHAEEVSDWRVCGGWVCT